MEERWQAKCSSEWQPANQMDMNSRRNFPPFSMQGTNPKDHPTVQEPLVFHTFNLDLAQSGKTELSNSFVALLSGHPHLSADISQLPNSRPALPKLPIHSGGANFCVPATSIPSLSENHVDDSTHNKQTSSFVESRQSLLPNSTKAPDLRNSRHISTSHFHGLRASKPASDQSFQASNRGMVVSPNWTVGASPGDTSQQHTLNIQNAQKTRIETGPFASGHNSADFRGRPRVFCMNTAGLLFLSDMGLLGIICFCHSLQMSVAKFCEHSGSSSVNPGEAVRLENGMTIAQWCRLCSGNNPPDDGKGWDWLGIPRAKGRLAGSQDNNFPSLSKIPGTIDFGGSGRSGECGNKTAHNNLKNWTNKGTGNMHQRNGVEGYNHFLNDFPTTSQSSMPAFVNSHTVQAGKKSPSCMGSEASRSFFDNKEKNVWPCLIANRDNFKGRFGSPSIPLTYSNIKENLSHEHNVSRGKEYAMVGDGNSSNVDLRLGQPSQHTLAYATSFPTTMNPLQVGEVRISRKAPINLPPTETTGHVRLTKKPRQSLQCTQVEASSSNREQAVRSSNAFSQTECEPLTGNSTKNSLISLFLSHLSTEGNSLSQSNPIVNNNRYLMARPLDLHSVSSYIPENISETNNRHERKYSVDGSGLSNNIDKVKGQEIVDTRSCHIVKGSYMVHNKQRTDTTVVRTANGAHCLHSNFSVGDSQPSWHINHQSSILQNGPDALNCNKYGEVPFLGSKDNRNHTVCGSTNAASHATARSDLSSSGTLMTLTSPKAMDTSEPTFPLPNKRSIDRSQHLMDENMRLVALRHSVDLSKQEQSGATCRTSTGHQRLCCHSTMQLQRVLCKDMLGSPEEFRHGSGSDVQQDASQFAIRPAYSYLNCYSAGGAEMLASKPGVRGNECCSCTAVTPRISQCSSCHVCGAADHPCLRLERIPNISSEGFKQMYDQKEKTSSISRNCCCTGPSKNLTGCCFVGGDKPSVSTNEQSVPGKARIVHINPACDKDHMFQCGENIRLGRCEFSRKNILIMNDCKTGHWRDVPSKSIGQSDGNFADKPAQMLEDSSVARNQCPGTALKETDGAHQMSESRKEQQMSNNCSGSSALAITEISAEVNNTNFHAINIENAKNTYNPLVDEASGIEKCGSSDEALGSGECEVLTVSSKVFSNQSDCSPCHSSGNPYNELRSESPSHKRRVRRGQGFAGCGAQENIKKMMPIERVWKVDKPNVSVPKPSIYPINEMSPHCKSDSSWNFCSPRTSEAPQSDNMDQNMCDFPIKSSTVKRKRSALSASRPLPLSREDHGNLSESDKIQIGGDDQSLKVSAEKEAKVVHLEKDITEQKGSHLTAGKPPKYMSLSCIRDCNGSGTGTGTSNTKARPVVCGKSGIISNGRLHGQQKPAKIVSLSLILKKSKRCDMNDSGVKPKPLLTSKNKETHDADVRCCNQLTSWKLQHKNELCSKVKINGSALTTVLMSDKNVGYSNNSDRCLDDYPMTESETGDERNRVEKSSLNHKKPNSKTKSRHREARRSSLSKLLGISEYATADLYAPNLGKNHISNSGGEENQTMALPLNTAGIECQPESSIQKCSLLNNIRLEKYSQNNEDRAGAHCRTTTQRSSEVRKCQPFNLNSDAFCCVCGSLNKEANNFLLECKHCFIRVHQACYGVSKVPKGDWFCRPCKTDSQNTACVLCGYGDGAMTRAVKSQNIVRSLLKVWDVGTRSSLLELVPPLKSDRNKSLHPISFGEASKFGNTDSISVVTSTSCEGFPKTAFDTSPNQTSTIGYSESLPKKFELCNSITAGVLDSSVTQWVHMVCGLWTPGTRCPNVDTMSAFDVSGASAARKNIVCSMCNRPGGCCIQCRVLSCSVHFHPWCAHQKGLLQSETEGDDNENVGFYGRCTLHSTQNGFQGPVDAEIESLRKDWACARTEGFKGRKSERGSKQYHRMPYKDNGGCIVSQEQINAWLHINGQKSCTRPVVKSTCSEVEHDFRKEYFRYKQLKAWKHLVVYKSGIHALGLYTSQLIARGAMVVEYVGEIVGLRIADKRELEYQSGKRLQYKSACYFFRIDKEHIIDATRKGGIARFVNHSCLPNCVAKIISVRNEKKVVFFAERDINPGEEITYDYHFNREDEGQKILCFCNSKNCRRYLN